MYQRENVNRLSRQINLNPRDFWRSIRGGQRQAHRLPNISDHELLQHFTRLNGTAPDTSTYFDSIVRDAIQSDILVNDDILDSDITPDELIHAISQLKPRKASGTDKLITELFIHGKHIIVPHLTTLFNVILNSGNYPMYWAEAILHLIYKKGDANDPSNYRDISLLSVLGKLFERVLYNRIKLWEVEHHILNEEQAGFRSGYSTQDNIYVLQSLIYKSLHSRQRIYCAFIDLRKAYNSVYRQGLWYKLIQYGIQGKLLAIMRSMYDKVKCCVRGHDGLTTFFHTLLGLQQGAVLSCYLFAFYLNDLPEIIKDNNPDGGVDIDNTRIWLLMFADDIVFLSNTPVGLQESLDLFYDYCEKWKLSVNLQKSQVLICKRGGTDLPDEVWFCGDQMLDRCHTYTYLGVTFTPGGITNQSLNVLTNQAKKSLASLHVRMNMLGKFPPSLALRCFHTSISPILNYCAGAWGFMQAKCMQTLLNRFCKNILGVKLSTSNYAIASELGQFPLIIYRKTSMIKYWLKIICGSHDRYRYICYKYLRNTVINVRAELYHRNWANEVKQILIDVGRYDVWINENVAIAPELFAKQIQASLVDLYIHEWTDGIHLQDKMSTYRLFKHIFCHEMYLCTISIHKLCRLRVSSHNLNIEMGRYPRAPQAPVTSFRCLIIRWACDGAVVRK